MILNHNKQTCDVSVIASENSWIESQAISQLEGVARLPGMKKAVGMPDLHPGRGNPVGAAFYSEELIYPYLVGGDIGCGMGLWKTNLKTRKIKRDKWVKKLSGLDEPWNGEKEVIMKRYDLNEWDDALGTIGGGNHFAELQKISKISDENESELNGIEKDKLYLMVHSGSRGLGKLILNCYMDNHGVDGLVEGSSEFVEYLKQHDFAVNWAEANREVIAIRFLESIHAKGERLVDVCHNSVGQIGRGWLHRKGAAPAHDGLVLIPGSRGHQSYIVKPIGNQEDNCWSLAHGAGRKFNRSDCRKRFSRKFSVSDLQQTKFGSSVICENKELLYEEIPEAYKNIHQVIGDMLELKLIKVVAILDPVITYKTRR